MFDDEINNENDDINVSQADVSSDTHERTTAGNPDDSSSEVKKSDLDGGTIKEFEDVEDSSASEVRSEPSEADTKLEEEARPRRAKHAADLPEYEIASQNMRKKLMIANVALVVVLALAAVAFGLYVFNSQNVSVEQHQAGQSDVSQMQGSDSQSNGSEKTATVPEIAGIIGTSVDDVTSAIGHGAQVTSDTEKDDEDDPIKRVVKYSLANDQGDSTSWNPVVIAYADKDNDITQITYQASTKALGYGTMSFQDAVANERIIEKIMAEAGLKISSDDVSLPDDKSDYTTYTDDGKRISKEELEFSGDADYSGTSVKWSARLLYDYTVSLATDNLADTVRMITVTISK